jgi:hypothetical protein
MNIDVDNVRAWLIDSGNFEAASLLSEAQFDYVFVDMAFRMDAEEEFMVYELIIKVPPRIYRQLGSKYKDASDQIEAAYQEIQQHARGGFAKSITWSAKLPSIDEVEGTPDVGEIFADSSLADVQRLWTKAKARLRDDPEGAVTAARTMIESACKVLIDEWGGSYTNNDDLPKLFKELSSNLGISAASQVVDEYRKLGGACSTIVNAISCIRNRTGDAHSSAEKVDPTHASLVVNLAGSLVSYLVATSSVKKGANQTVERTGAPPLSSDPQ